MTRGSERCFKVFSLDLNQIMLSALIAPTYLGPAHSGVWLQGHANWAPDRIFPDEHRRGEPVAVLFDNTRLKQHVLALWSYFAVHACGSLTHVCHDQTDRESERIDLRPQSLDRGSPFIHRRVVVLGTSFVAEGRVHQLQESQLAEAATGKESVRNSLAASL